MRGHFLQIITRLQGRWDTITLAHLQGPYMQIHRRIRRELHPSGEFGEWIEDAALHNPLPYLCFQGRSQLNPYTANQTATSPNMQVRERNQRTSCNYRNADSEEQNSRERRRSQNEERKNLRLVEQCTIDWLKGPGTETRRNTRKNCLATVKTLSTWKARKRERKPNGGGVM